MHTHLIFQAWPLRLEPACCRRQCRAKLPESAPIPAVKGALALGLPLSCLPLYCDQGDARCAGASTQRCAGCYAERLARCPCTCTSM